MAQGWDPDILDGKIYITDVQYDDWKSHIVQTFFSCNFPNVREFVDTVIKNKRQIYTFAGPIGEGSRFWIATLIQDFTDAGQLGKECPEVINKKVVNDWKGPHNLMEQRPLRAGIFRSDN